MPSNSAPRLCVKKLSPNASLPVRATPRAAGYDLFASASLEIPSRGKALVPTDISICIPHGTYARIAPRSGLAHKHFIDVGAGVIDEDYRGPVGVILFNFGEQSFQVQQGDRIAQLILERIESEATVEEVQELPDTERGEGGFGSTGGFGEAKKLKEEAN
jgi:dUTP pyrophosphatase